LQTISPLYFRTFFNNHIFFPFLLIVKPKTCSKIKQKGEFFMIMMLLRWVLFALAVMLVAWIIPGISVENIWAALGLAAIIGLVNLLIKPVLSLITMPVNFLTLGLFGVVLNALLLMLAGYFAPGVAISGFWPALFGSLLLGLIGGAIYQIPEVNRV